MDSLGLLAGDLDADGEVAFSDFLILSTNFGDTGGGYPAGDIDLSGDIAFADFLTLSTNFGKSRGETVGVPEPTTYVMFLIGVFIIAGRYRR